MTATIESTAVTGVNAFDQGLIEGVERAGDEIAIDTLRWNEEEQQIQVYGRGGWEQATVRGVKKHDEWRQLLQMRDVAVTRVRSELEERPRSERIALREELIPATTSTWADTDSSTGSSGRFPPASPTPVRPQA
ncbi:hypothetical protein ACFVWF_30455 [Rhodococcus qingshengii]|uniref:hypothetical protein n=1 Tax=Rhodococcus qingshengii TaxID=334542 RepID=UPI0036DBC97D